MAVSKCVKCDGPYFEMVELSLPTRVAHRYMAIQCSRCGGVVGVLNYVNLNHQHQDIGKLIQAVSKLVQRVAHKLGA